MIPNFWGASLSPGNEQSFRFGSEAAKTEGSFNFAGVQNEAVDAMIEALLAAETREAFVSAVRALDRVLLSGDYVVPLFYLPRQWVRLLARVEATRQDTALRLSDRRLVARPVRRGRRAGHALTVRAMNRLR